MRLALYGAASFGRCIAPLARDLLTRQAAANAAPDDLVFVSDREADIGRRVNGVPVIGYPDLLRQKDRRIIVALADGKTRRQIVTRCTEDGFAFATLTAATHRALEDVQVGEGAVICDNTLFTANIRIGKHFHCNIYSYVEHDCVIGDYVTFAPRVNCNGHIVIEDDVYVGACAMLKQGNANKPLIIGKGAVIGMGAVVTQDVAAGAVVVGNPARPFPSA